MHFIDPGNRRPWKEAAYVIRLQYTVIKGRPESNGFALHRILMGQRIIGQDVFDGVDKLIIQAFIGIEVQHPVGRRLLKGKVALS